MEAADVEAGSLKEEEEREEQLGLKKVEMKHLKVDFSKEKEIKEEIEGEAEEQQALMKVEMKYLKVDFLKEKEIEEEIEGKIEEVEEEKGDKAVKIVLREAPPVVKIVLVIATQMKNMMNDNLKVAGAEGFEPPTY